MAPTPSAGRARAPAPAPVRRGPGQFAKFARHMRLVGEAAVGGVARKARFAGQRFKGFLKAEQAQILARRHPDMDREPALERARRQAGGAAHGGDRWRRDDREAESVERGGGGQTARDRIEIGRRAGLPAAGEVRERRAAERGPCPGPEAERLEAGIAADRKSLRPVDEADDEARGLVAVPARSAAGAADQLDAAVGGRLLLDPVVRRAVRCQRPACLDQPGERGRRGDFAIVHRSG